MACHLQHTAGPLTSRAGYTICGSVTRLPLQTGSRHTLRRNAGTPETNSLSIGQHWPQLRRLWQQHMHYLCSRFARDQKGAGCVNKQSPICEVRQRAIARRNAQGRLERTDLAKLAKRKTGPKMTTRPVKAQCLHQSITCCEPAHLRMSHEAPIRYETGTRSDHPLRIMEL